MPGSTKRKTQPDMDTGPTRMTTRTRNATAHPGNVLLENSRVRRSREEVLQEKNLKLAQKEEKKRKKAEAEALKAAGNAFVAQRDKEDAAAAVNAERKFPRHQTGTQGKTNIPDNKVATKGAKRKVSHKVQVVDTQQEIRGNRFDSDLEASPRPQPKKAKLSDKARPRALRHEETMVLESHDSHPSHHPGTGNILRRTETTLEALYSDEMLQQITSDDTDVEMLDDELTPRPNKNKNQTSDSEEDVERDEVFRTPLMLERHKPKLASFESQDSSLSELSESEEVIDDGEENRVTVKGKDAHKYKQAKATTADTVNRTMLAIDGDNTKPHISYSKSSGPAVDFRQFSRVTSSNSAVSKPVLKPIVSKSIAPKASYKSTASEAVSRRLGSTVSKSTSEATRKQSTALKDTAQKQSTTSKEAARKQSTAPKEVTSKPATKELPVAVGTHDGGQDSEAEPVVGGLLDEDDSLERDVAMSSPLKGVELQAAKQSIVKARPDQDRKPRKRATIQDLPDGANDDSAWTRLVVPNFIRLIMAGEQPWFIGDDVIVSCLQDVWDYVYGRKIHFEVKRGTVPFVLAVQKLYDYRNKIASNALNVVFAFLYHLRGDKDDADMDSDELERLAKGLLANREQFIFKGMENTHRPKKTGTFRHTLIVETLSTHFSNFMQGKSLRGLEIGEPQLSLALSAAAVERALELFARGMIDNHPDAKGKTKLVVQKSYSPDTGVLSTVSAEFSAQGWNKATMEYLGSVKQLGIKRLKVILDEAKGLVQTAPGSTSGDEVQSGRATLCSDDENW